MPLSKEELLALYIKVTPRNWYRPSKREVESLGDFPTRCAYLNKVLARLQVYTEMPGGEKRALHLSQDPILGCGMTVARAIDQKLTESLVPKEMLTSV